MLLWLNFSYFFLFDVIINKIIFLISIFDYLLLMYINTTDFCILILLPTTVLNLFISSNSFIFWWKCVDSLGFSIYKITPFTNVVLLSNLGALFFLCLNALARTSSTMLNSSGQSRHPNHVLDCRGKDDVVCGIFTYVF